MGNPVPAPAVAVVRALVIMAANVALSESPLVSALWLLVSWSLLSKPLALSGFIVVDESAGSSVAILTLVLACEVGVDESTDFTEALVDPPVR